MEFKLMSEPPGPESAFEAPNGDAMPPSGPRRSRHSHHRSHSHRALIAFMVVGFVLNAMITASAIALVLDARVEIGDLKAKLKDQKELLANILNYATGAGEMDGEGDVAESARVALGLGGTKKESETNGDAAAERFTLPPQLRTDSEEANANGGGAYGSDSDVRSGSDRAGRGGETDAQSGRGQAMPEARAGGKRKRRSAPILPCDCSDPNATPRSLNGCCCKKRALNAELYNKTAIEQFSQIMSGKAAGHFVACTPSQKDLQANRIRGQMIAYNLFRSSSKDIFIGDAEPWSTFPSSNAAFVFDSLTTTMTIKQPGLYLVYVQVAHVLFTISSMIVNNDEWLRCQHRPATNEYHLPITVMGRESCSMFGVRPLLAGDRIRIVNGVAGVVAEVTQSHCTNFGIVKIG